MFFDGRIRDLGEMPPELLRAATDKLGQSDHLWTSDQTKFLTKFAGTEHIVLRFPDNYPESHRPASYRPAWSAWETVLAPLIERAVRPYQYSAFDTAKVMLTRLRPGAVIAEHVDKNPSSQVPHKIHIPLRSDPRVHFHIGGVSHYLQVGRAYEINNLLPHQVENRSDQDRIHIIFESYPTLALEQSKAPLEA
jgi:Aspartyl/Asparaginyl beta-hydroxylase